MKTKYPQSSNYWFKGYPRTIKVICGPDITNLGGPWVDGSAIILSQTPLSKVHSDAYVEGYRLPNYKLIYSESTSDTNYKIMFRLSGVSELFFSYTEDNLWLSSDKYFEVLSTYNNKHLAFHRRELIYTQIPKTVNINGFWNPNASGGAVWVGDPVTPPVIILDGEQTNLISPEAICRACALQIILTSGYYAGVYYTIPYTLSVGFSAINPVGYTQELIESRSSFWYFSCGLYANGKTIQMYKNWNGGGILIFLVTEGLTSYTVSSCYLLTSVVYNGTEVINDLRSIVG